MNCCSQLNKKKVEIPKLVFLNEILFKNEFQDYANFHWFLAIFFLLIIKSWAIFINIY